MTPSRMIEQPGDSDDDTGLSPPPGSATILDRVRSRTPARILAGRAGSSYRTATYLELRRDHAAARDAVHAELDLGRDLGPAFVAEWGLFEIATMAKTRSEFLLRPELGRSLDPSARPELSGLCPTGADIQVAIADGLSAVAVRRRSPRCSPCWRRRPGAAAGGSAGRSRSAMAAWACSTTSARSWARPSSCS